MPVLHAVNYIPGKLQPREEGKTAPYIDHKTFKYFSMKASHMPETIPLEWKSTQMLGKQPINPLLTFNPFLTKREIEIVKLIFDDYGTCQIAEALTISPKTVDTHRKNIMKKTGVRSAIGLVKFALLNGLLQIKIDARMSD